MRFDLIELALNEIAKPNVSKDIGSPKSMLRPAGIKKVSSRAYSYTQRHRGQWFSPEYDFNEISIAQDTESYIFRALQKKTNRILCAGWEWVGDNPDNVSYIKRRIREMELATGKPFSTLIADLSTDMFRFSNHMWVKVRDVNKSSGKIRTSGGKELEPVAGYFVLPFETLEFKSKANGELKKVMQKMPDGTRREFFPRDLIHFFANRKPGFSVGTPELWPALEDVALLRRVEENVEELIDSNLFPVFHYKVGTDQFPERYGPDGEKETDIVKGTVDYMPPGGVYVSDHRHEILAVGSEGKALRLDFYLSYFKARVMAALGVSPVDMGEGNSANRSTASTMSKSMMMDVEAMTCKLKEFIEFYVINELLLEAGVNILDESEMVHIKFGTIDKDERRADENQQIQMYLNNLRTIDEVRKTIGDRPIVDEAFLPRTFFKRHTEPLALMKGMGAGSAASQALAESPESRISSSGVAKEEAFSTAMTQATIKKAGQSGAKPKGLGSGGAKTSAAKARPSNQHGVRANPKTNRDLTQNLETTTIKSAIDNCHYTLPFKYEVDSEVLEEWKKSVDDRYKMLKDSGISFQTVAENLEWRLKQPLPISKDSK